MGGGPRKSQLKSLYCYCLVIYTLFWLHTFLSQVRGQSHRPVKEAGLLSWCAMWCLTIGSFMLPVRIAFLHQQNHASAMWMLLIGGLRSLNEVSFCLDYCFIPLRMHVPETSNEGILTARERRIYFFSNTCKLFCFSASTHPSNFYTRFSCNSCRGLLKPISAVIGVTTWSSHQFILWTHRKTKRKRKQLPTTNLELPIHLVHVIGL